MPDFEAGRQHYRSRGVAPIDSTDRRLLSTMEWRGDGPSAPFILSCGSPQPPHQQGMSLHAQIPFPAAVHRTAVVAADRCDDAHEQIHEPTWDSVHRAVAAGACVFGRGTASVVGATVADGGGRIHDLDHLVTTLPHRLHREKRLRAASRCHTSTHLDAPSGSPVSVSIGNSSGAELAPPISTSGGMKHLQRAMNGALSRKRLPRRP